VDSGTKVDAWRTLSLLAPLTDDGAAWSEAGPGHAARPTLTDRPEADAQFSALPAAALRGANYAAWGKALAARLYESARSDLFVCKALDFASNPDESEGDFRARLAHAAREQRDAAVGKVRDKFAAKRVTLADQLRRAEERVGRERDQLTERRTQTAVSIGSAVLGALFGRKAISASSVGRAATAMRTASRVGREKEDVTRAEDSVEALRQRLADFDAECEADLKAAGEAFEAGSLALERRSLAPRKGDIAIGEVALAWAPWRRGADGFPAPAWDLPPA
jgi:hypothetical protein